jgi:hypothetical protein
MSFLTSLFGVYLVVDGNWGAWSSWSECDELCGGAKVTRTRQCDNPAPANKGKDCVGPKEETKMDCTQECEGIINVHKNKKNVRACGHFRKNVDCAGSIHV